jgi:hypothetical protein
MRRPEGPAGPLRGPEHEALAIWLLRPIGSLMTELAREKI